MKQVTVDVLLFVGKTLVDFFAFIAKQSGEKVDDQTVYDASKVEVSPELKELFYQKTIDAYHATRDMCSDIWKHLGPRTDESFPKNTAIIQDGFVTQPELASHDAAEQDVAAGQDAEEMEA